jgi:hypothetical protein
MVDATGLHRLARALERDGTVTLEAERDCSVTFEGVSVVAGTLLSWGNRS